MDLATPGGTAALAAIISSAVAVVSLALNTATVLFVSPRRDHEAWRRGRLEQHVLEIVQVARTLRASMTNYQVAVEAGSGQKVEDLMRSQDYLSVARPQQERQLAVLDAGIDQLAGPVDGVSLLASNELGATVQELLEAITEMRSRLDRSVRAVNPEIVAFGHEYGQLLGRWRDAETAFAAAARGELGIRSPLLKDLGSRWRWFR